MSNLIVQNLNITIKKTGRTLINDLSFSLQEGDKLAIIGEEGNGKSSIAKAIAVPNDLNKYADITGQIIFDGTIGYLEQILSSSWNDQEVYKYFLKDNPNDEDDYDRYETFGTIDMLVSSLGLKPELLETNQKIGSLSGGEKVKIQLIKLLLKEPDMLVLDEPTNDLDIETLEWLEAFIKNYNKPIMYISHDEALLENTANMILHVEQLKKKTVNKCTVVSLGYKDYVERRNQLLEKQTQVALNERAEDRARMEKWNQIYNKVDHDLNSISRKDPHGARLLKKKMQSVKSQEKRFERERKEFTEIPDSEESIFLNFGEKEIPNGKVVCDFNLDNLYVEDKTLAVGVGLKVVGPERVVIVGTNGSGKTTLIRSLYDDLCKRTDISVGYMPQNYEDYLSKYKSVIDYISENAHSKDEMTRLRTFLGCLKFTHEEVVGDIKNLSGGQKAKLYLAKLMASGCDVLLLDEPTRNLSPLSGPVVREALNSFGGAIISVSHDRKFIQEIADSVYRLTPNGLVEDDSFFLKSREQIL